MRLSTIFLLCCLLLLGGIPAQAGLVAPLDSRGGLQFDVDFPVFPEAGGWRGDLQVQIPNRELVFRVDPGREEAVAAVRLEVSLARQGNVLVDRKEHFALSAVGANDAVSASHFQLLELPLDLAPGRWALRVRVVDLGAGSKAPGTATGVLEVPQIQGGRRLAGPEFRAPGGLPHPGRLYGISADTLRLYFELHGFDPGEVAELNLEVIDPNWGNQASQELKLEVGASPSAHEWRLPVGDLPEGHYELHLDPRWAGGEPLVREFSVNWRIGRAVQYQRDLRLEADLVLPAAEIDDFKAMPRGAQMQWLERFWRVRDPTPGTDANERYELFLARVNLAEKRYGRAGHPGALSDRGRILVRYGPADEISVEVVPVNSGELEDAIEKVHDTYAFEKVGSISKEALQLGPAEQRRTVGRDKNRNATRANREGAFELWRYTSNGDPLFEEGRSFSENLGFSFLFVDRRGDGDYLLEYSNLPTYVESGAQVR